jgi:uncharacterized RDD family membrane protein YckC
VSEIQAPPQPISLGYWPRAGFWRRAAAFVIDALLIAVPFQILVAVVYPLTNGAIQVSSGIVINSCGPVNITKLPTDLPLPPPVGANYAHVCRTSLFGWETARWLAVGRVTKEGIVTKKIEHTYRMGPDNKLRNAYAVDWIVMLAMFIYLVTLEHRAGVTVGKRQLGLQVVDANDPDRAGVPLRNAVARNLLMWIGVVPALVVLVGAFLSKGADADAIFTDTFFFWFSVAGLFGLMIVAWMAVDMARKRDPLYDAMARTAVIRV